MSSRLGGEGKERRKVHILGRACLGEGVRLMNRVRTFLTERWRIQGRVGYRYVAGHCVRWDHVT